MSEILPCPACNYAAIELVRVGDRHHAQCGSCHVGGPHAWEAEGAIFGWNALPRREEPPRFPAGMHFRIEHDGFEGSVIGHYTRLDGKRGVVGQQAGTNIVHVYGEKWLLAAEADGNKPS